VLESSLTALACAQHSALNALLAVAANTLARVDEKLKDSNPVVVQRIAEVGKILSELHLLKFVTPVHVHNEDVDDAQVSAPVKLVRQLLPLLHTFFSVQNVYAETVFLEMLQSLDSLD
jgi:hypothetical protein